MNYITVALLFLIIGLVLYFLPLDPAKPSSGKIQDVGRIMFIICFFVIFFCGCWGNHAVVGLVGR